MLLIVILMGLIVGSFIAAYTYRAENEISIAHGRSFCPKCKKQIKWYDNIPVFSYLLLCGKCRNCHKRISIRYPTIELANTLLYLIIYFNLHRLIDNLPILHGFPDLFSVVILLLVSSILLAIFVTDFEKQIIPDEPVFLGFGLTFLLLVGQNNMLFPHFLAGFLSALFLLLIFLLTLGKGMGLGDVKFAVFVGSFLGLLNSLIWLFGSFVIGSMVGLVLISLGQAKFGRHIAFGPFLIISFYVTVFYARELVAILFPYIL